MTSRVMRHYGSKTARRPVVTGAAREEDRR